MTLLDSSGRPLRFEAQHKAADLAGNELGRWAPALMSPDASYLPEMDTIRSRTGDLIRNHGLLSGGVQTHLDNVIGSNLRLSAKPDYVALGQDQEWAREWQREVEAKFSEYADDIDCYCDASRRLDFGGLISQGYRSYLTNYEILATAEWLPGRGGKYATAIQMLNPARLNNPDGESDTEFLRAGVELDKIGAPVAYNIASSMWGDFGRYGGKITWDRVPRQTPWGRQMVIHIYDVEEPGLSRGKHGLISVIGKSKMLEKFEHSTLQAAILNAMYAAVIESPLDWESVGQAIGMPGDSDPTLAYLQNKAQFHKEGHIRYDGVKVPHLYPGEKLEFTSPKHPSAQFAEFEEATLRHLAGGLNLTYEQLSRDYSKTNYSSARAAMLESWKFFKGRRHTIAGKLARQIYALWLEEAMDIGEVSTPPGAPPFRDAKSAWTKSSWIGAGRGHIDPLKEKKATAVDFELGLTTLEKEAAEGGEDWERLMEQRAVEYKRAEEIAQSMGVPIEHLLPQKQDTTLPQEAEVNAA